MDRVQCEKKKRKKKKGRIIIVKNVIKLEGVEYLKKSLKTKTDVEELYLHYLHVRRRER